MVLTPSGDTGTKYRCLANTAVTGFLFSEPGVRRSISEAERMQGSVPASSISLPESKVNWWEPRVLTSRPPLGLAPSRGSESTG